MKKAVILLLMLTGTLACHKKSRYSVVPKISYISIEPKIIQAGSSQGGTLIKLYFEDGDGDIGFGTYNLYLKDSRFHDTDSVKMKIPEVPSAYSPQDGLNGFITVQYLAALLMLRPDTAHLHTDTLHWSIYMKDKAGHVSNTVVTEDLVLFK